MGIIDETGRRINPYRKRIKPGDLGELTKNKEWERWLFLSRGGPEKAKELAEKRKAEKKVKEEFEEKQAADRLKYRGY